jgi:hypothetical protein
MEARNSVQLAKCHGFSRLPDGLTARCITRMMRNFMVINHIFKKNCSEEVCKVFCPQRAEACARMLSEWVGKPASQ